MQFLIIRDDCFDHFRPDSCLCKVIAGPLVEQWLQQMPRLCSLTLYQTVEEHHGLSWPALHSMLSLPGIRELKLDRLHFCPELRPSDDLHIESFGQLTSLECLNRMRADPHVLESRYTAKSNHSDQLRAFSVTLGALHKTLEVLSLPTESAPMDLLARLPWPRMQRLVLRGEPSESLVLSLISNLSHIPTLRSLILKFSSTKDIPVRAGALWRGGLTDPFPCPGLEELVVTYPDPADHLFDHLPPALLTLSLCCWRHLYHEFLSQYRRWDPRDGLRFRLLLSSASEMHAVLRRSRTTRLRHLTLEYRADDGDDELLRFIAQEYPRLAYLKLIRYRPDGVDDVPIERIAQTLHPLAQLSELKIHLDLPEMPLPGRALRRGIGGVYSLSDMEQFDAIINDMANVFARELSPSVRLLSVFTPTAQRSDWARFHIARGEALPAKE